MDIFLFLKKNLFLGIDWQNNSRLINIMEIISFPLMLAHFVSLSLFIMAWSVKNTTQVGWYLSKFSKKKAKKAPLGSDCNKHQESRYNSVHKKENGWVSLSQEELLIWYIWFIVQPYIEYSTTTHSDYSFKCQLTVQSTQQSVLHWQSVHLIIAGHAMLAKSLLGTQTTSLSFNSLNKACN